MRHLSALGPTIILVMWIETFAAAVFVGLRMYTRYYIVQATGYDDWLIVASILLFIGYTSFCTVAAVYGLGSHFLDITEAQFVLSNKMEVAGQTCNIIAIATSKSSVAVFLLRLVVVPWHKVFLWACIVSTFIVCIICATLDFFQCSPMPAIFNPSIPHTVNFNFTANAIFSGGYTALMDFVLALFPWYFLAGVRIRRKERLTISFGLTLGVFAGICGIVRAVELGGLASRSDYTYDTVPLILWGSSELLVAIVCACIPVLRPLYKQLRGQEKQSNESSGPYPNRSGSKIGHGYALSSMRRDEFAANERGEGTSNSSQNNNAQDDIERDATGLDNGSDESILRDAWRYGIKETTEVHVTYG
ncbi:hypothetical protein SS1G_13103 [Sclerotinia sclerotiorum 1980 UF-70]|uniref:Rhodopsin domain-containing protein n=2 Tax=Sclerotinia sclerotiorum (strain ATCC 18683 / 1980 / Ss-1) TaxID=665079 RepID=A7F674_SCLS1|nr:hypothetical protein SS1G_13103 [Sclerotinia sclerotiorum 1980 UF-70]APA07333.1 hypothetical protein sscle_02g021030 [Sclerotinia sclerotiorum 1980 UF-70]EDN98245.1 hypothetical protein SS1G_13103 [Sclerotinia sclerotiorum 1980 UF-70]